jgi:phage tail sheath protein FI
MPISPTYPGVYIQEVPSGARTIVGVSTSVTAFIGAAKRGPINRATRIQGFADFERRFGGLDPGSLMSYAVRQFFLNGGGDAWVVRLAKNAQPASRTLQTTANQDVLDITAVDAGASGNNIETQVNYRTTNPASTFNLVLNYTPPDSPSDAKSETFANLSMNPGSPDFVEAKVNGVSELVTVKRAAAPPAAGTGTSTSGPHVDVAGPPSVLDATHNEFRVAVNGPPDVVVRLNPATDLAGANPAARLATLCAAIQAQVPGITCVADATNTRIVMTSNLAGNETSSVHVEPGERNDASGRLKLGTANGGTEVEGAATRRPKEIPDRGALTSGAFGAAELTALPDPTHKSFEIAIDNYGPDVVTLAAVAAAGPGIDERLDDISRRIEEAVHVLKPSNPSYRDFAIVVDKATDKITLLSGRRGAGTAVAVFDTPAASIANELHLLGVAPQRPTNVMLQGGNEAPYTDADAYKLFIGDRSKREGVFALEGVDIFNLLCLPGVADPGILMDADAYCKERRAFLIADAAPTVVEPDAMERAITGTAFPKTNYGAVYYPWIRIADPLQNGKLKSVPPSGTIAGLYARTDTARGVWKAPAGTEADLRGVQGVTYRLSDPENGRLNPLGVNCIRLFPVFGAVAWGTRTLRGADQLTDEYKYVPIRRLALYIEETLYRNTQWVVFEPNDKPLWSQIRLNVGAFMQNLFRQGAFQGDTPAKAYFVKVDDETTTQTDIDSGIVNIVVGFAPLKPAEFVIITVKQIAGQAQA